MLKKYKTLEDWQRDYQLFRENPDDRNLMASVAIKMENSTS
jgi:hypothetical protein